jgi:hypothetical protein
MDCPLCNWKLRNLKEWVTQEGYYGEANCKDCAVTLLAQMDLYKAYENNHIPSHLLLEAEQLLLASGRLATPP